MMAHLLSVAALWALLLQSGPGPDAVTFHANGYGCDLRIFSKPVGRIEPGQPRTVPLPRGREYLVECESHDIPVKLYARNYVFARGDFRDSPLPADVQVRPVAVLPNLVRAAAAKAIQVKAIADTSSVGCKVEKGDPNSFSRVARQVAPTLAHRIPNGTRVELTGAAFMHCGDTNLIEVVVGNATDWFKNRHFEFSYKDKPIPLFPVSQDLACCWIE